MDGNYCIYAASALALHGIDVGDTDDIDIITSTENVNRLRILLFDYLYKEPKLKETELFRSEFAQFHLPLMELEVSGNLQVCKEGEWHDVVVYETKPIVIYDNMSVNVASLTDIKRILKLFGRPKDLKRLKSIDLERTSK